ncbi:hypothetical protein [Acutalibacter sp. M00204]|uniref:hypothetical protein n=1 Tax=Acutalibacter intestini TaxID=3093659 RepID=UPI002AC9ACD8|nr:hypothetical protein [Acutalibacter sp. M00204]
MTTKVHAVVDGLGNPLRPLLSPGNRNDICYAQKLLEPFDLQGKYVIGLSIGWRNAGPLLGFQAAKLPSIPAILTGIFTRNAIWWRIYSSSLRPTAAFPPDMKNAPTYFLLLLFLPPSSFGLLEFEDAP